MTMSIRPDLQYGLFDMLRMNLLDLDMTEPICATLEELGYSAFVAADVSECPDGEPEYFDVYLADVEEVKRVILSPTQRLEDLSI